jgi:hypothetical protein
VKKKRNTNLQNAIVETEAGLKQLRSATFHDDPKRAVEAAKVLVAKQAKLIEAAKIAAQQSPDAAVGKRIAQAVTELEALIPQQIAATKDLVQNHGDESWDKLADVIGKTEAALADIAEAANPTPTLAIASLAKKEEAEFPKLANAAKKGDAKAVQDILKNIQDLNNKLVDKSKEEIVKQDPGKSQEMAAAAKNLSDAVQQLAPLAKNAANNKGK